VTVIGGFARHGLDAAGWRSAGLNQATCRITIVEWVAKRPPMLIRFKDTGHLEQ
jgi:hypothetical protein